MYFCKIGPDESPHVLILELYSEGLLSGSNEGLDEEWGEWRLPRLPDGTW